MPGTVGPNGWRPELGERCPPPKGGGERNSDQRPACSTPETALWRDFRGKPLNGSRFSWGNRSTRSPSKLSEVTHPWVANSANDSSTRVGSMPLTLPTNSLKKSAPFSDRARQTWLASGVNSGATGGGDKDSQLAMLSRENTETGLERIG